MKRSAFPAEWNEHPDIPPAFALGVRATVPTRPPTIILLTMTGIRLAPPGIVLNTPVVAVMTATLREVSCPGCFRDPDLRSRGAETDTNG